MARDKTDKSDITPAATLASSPPDLLKTAYREALENAKTSLSRVKLPHYANGYYDEAIAVYGGLTLLESNPEKLVVLSETEPDDFLALRLGVAAMLEASDPLPPEAMSWLIKYLRCEVSCPAKKTGAKSKPSLHNMVAQAVADCLPFGLKATRNDASPAVSACDAVAEALTELDLTPATYHSIKRIWLDLPPRVRAMYASQTGSASEE
jgi:hypothetical protein